MVKERITAMTGSCIVKKNKFVPETFMLKATNCFKYTKNDQTCSTAISNFKQIGYPVSSIYDNWEDETWLFWCLGISKFEFQSWPSVENATDLVGVLYPKRQYFLDYTQKRMI